MNNDITETNPLTALMKSIPDPFWVTGCPLDGNVKDEDKVWNGPPYYWEVFFDTSVALKIDGARGRLNLTLLSVDKIPYECTPEYDENDDSDEAVQKSEDNRQDIKEQIDIEFRTIDQVEALIAYLKKTADWMRQVENVKPRPSDILSPKG